jgi:carbonic anhydrase
MTKILDEVLAANAKYSDSFGDKGNLPLPPSRHFAILTCIGWHDTGQGPGSTEGNYINWLTFSDNAKSVVEDVRRIRIHSLVPDDIPIYGYIYDVKSGKLVEVPEATAAGKAS